MKENVDITFSVEGKPISAHKLILTTRSDYFARMFSNEWKETAGSSWELFRNTNFLTVIFMSCIIKNFAAVLRSSTRSTQFLRLYSFTFTTTRSNSLGTSMKTFLVRKFIHIREKYDNYWGNSLITCRIRKFGNIILILHTCRK